MSVSKNRKLTLCSSFKSSSFASFSSLKIICKKSIYMYLCVSTLCRIKRIGSRFGICCSFVLSLLSFRFVYANETWNASTLRTFYVSSHTCTCTVCTYWEACKHYMYALFVPIWITRTLSLSIQSVLFSSYGSKSIPTISFGKFLFHSPPPLGSFFLFCVSEASCGCTQVAL